MSACRSCGAPVEWAKSTKTGKPMIFDPLVTRPFWEPAPEPDTDIRGKYVLLGGRASAATDEDVRLGRPLRIAHWATCPHAKDWRKG